MEAHFFLKCEGGMGEMLDPFGTHSTVQKRAKKKGKTPNGDYWFYVYEFDNIGSWWDLLPSIDHGISDRQAWIHMLKNKLKPHHQFWGWSDQSLARYHGLFLHRTIHFERWLLVSSHKLRSFFQNKEAMSYLHTGNPALPACSGNPAF